MDISNEIKLLLRDELRRQRLVETGKLINSIQVSYTNNVIKVTGVDYFEFINQKYNIIDNVMKSNRFIELIAKKTLDDILKDLSI